MWWIPALVQGVTSVASATLGKPKTDTMSETRKLLGTLAGQGAYSSEDIRKTTGAVSREYATGEQAQTALIRGYLEKAGLGGSIAGARTLSQVQEPRKKAVAGVRTGMELENVRTKREATIDYANLVDQINRQRRTEKAELKRDLFKGMGQAGVSGYEMYLQGKQVEAEVGYKGAMEKYYGAGGYYGDKSDIPDFSTMSQEDIVGWVAQNKTPDHILMLLIQKGLLSAN